MAGNLTAMIAAAFSGGAAPPVTTDPYFDYTTLLLPGNGTNGAQNNTFLDGSTNNFTITRNGNTTQGTFSPFSQTGWGNYFPGTDPEAAIETSVSSKFAFGGNWTAELWYYPVERTGAYPVVFSIIDSSGATGFAFFDRHAGASSVFRFEGFSTSHNLNTVVQNNTWYHIALSYNGSVLSFYINGVLDSTLTVSIGSSNRALRIGRNYDSASYNESIKAYISNFRVISGQNLYTGTFTPSTTPLTATTVGSTGAGAASTITGTVQFLGCQSNRFVDNSPTPSSLTISNNPSVVAFSPFNPSASWSAATYGGSGYFDGSGDYLQGPVNSAFAFGTGEYCMEGWIYMTSAPASPSGLIDLRRAAPNYNAPWLNVTSGYKLALRDGTAGVDVVTGATNIQLNTWTHVAVTRQVTSNAGTRIFLNGVLDANSITNNSNYSNGALTLATAGDSLGSFMFTGYMSDVRITKGSVPTSYQTSATTSGTAVFTPPTSPETTTSQGASSPSILLNFTNAGIYDATSKNDLETVGNAQISTTQFQFAPSSMAFDGNGDYLIMPDAQTGQFLTGDFTVEYWCRFGSQGTNYAPQVGTLTSASPSGTWRFGTFTNNGGVYLAYHNGSAYVDVQFGSTAYNDNTWRHFALTRSGTTVRAFVNGTQVGTNQTVSQNFNSSNKVSVGAELLNPTYFNGYIQDLRITKGYARYTANFTAPTAAFPTL